MNRTQLQKIAIPLSGYVQWDIYRILHEAFCPYRGIKITTPKITKDELIKNLQFDNYIKFEGTNERTNELYCIALLNQNESGTNEIAMVTEKFRLFINSIKSDKIKHILIISPCQFGTHVLTHIYENTQGLANMISRYNYDHFKTIIPLGPYCSEHKLLTEDQAKQLLEYHNFEVSNMKRIYTTDPQIIWLGANPGDYVLITRTSQLAGASTEIRRVVPGLDF
jgi:DNA-directed RNA polymerase subunit H (RpoH/RPB5)